MIAAFVRLHQEHANTRLVLVGPYEEKLDPILPETKQLIETCDAIESVGNQKDVRPFYEQGDVFVFPSYREGFPNTVLEAGAMGLPSIVTDINGSREIISKGINGMIVPSKDEKALFNAMREMIRNKKGRIFRKGLTLYLS